MADFPTNKKNKTLKRVTYSCQKVETLHRVSKPALVFLKPEIVELRKCRKIFSDFIIAPNIHIECSIEIK